MINLILGVDRNIKFPNLNLVRALVVMYACSAIHLGPMHVSFSNLFGLVWTVKILKTIRKRQCGRKTVYPFSRRKLRFQIYSDSVVWTGPKSKEWGSKKYSKYSQIIFSYEVIHMISVTRDFEDWKINNTLGQELIILFSKLILSWSFYIFEIHCLPQSVKNEV